MEERTKRALMTQFPCARGRAFVCKNIGDYVQSVASRQYCQPLDEYIEQEEADKYLPEDKIPARMIMNGWFQWRAENWPPSEYVIPLLISMHISPLREKQLLTPQGIAFLKKHEPVGCRDHYTEKLLQSVGVKSYFSACMTLTLGKNYARADAKREKVYVVDPYFEIPDIVSEKDGKKTTHWGSAFKALFYSLFHLPSVLKLGGKQFFKEYSPTGFLDRNRKKYRSYYKAALFLITYTRKFDRHMLLSAEYITHWLDVDMSGKVTNVDLLNYAESLVKKYAEAKMVITSRIHAGLPSLGVGTPVVFIANEEVVSEKGSFNTPGRLGGLLEFFRTLNLSKDGTFSTDDEVFTEIAKFSEKTIFENKNDWKSYARELDKACVEFMK